LEVLSKMRHYEAILRWDEVSRLNESFSGVIERLRDDLQLAERLQKSRLPARFPDLKGVHAASRYLAGARSGGDHFDIAESADGSQVSIVLSDSSSYGLSSAVLAALMRVAARISIEESRSSAETLKRIHAELIATMKPKDRLSMFYGVLRRKDLSLRFVNVGSSCAFYSHANERFQVLPTQGHPISSSEPMGELGESEIRLQPGDRLGLLSDGFITAAGGERETCALLDGRRGQEAIDSINELVYRVKKPLPTPEDLPEQDCTALLLDVDSRVIRLAPGK